MKTKTENCYYTATYIDEDDIHQCTEEDISLECCKECPHIDNSSLICPVCKYESFNSPICNNCGKYLI